MKNRFTAIIEIILDFFLPKNSLDAQISKITAEELLEKIIHKKRIFEPQMFALFDYQDTTIKHMIRALKYKRNRKVARVFAEILNDYLVEELSDQSLFSSFNDPIIIPVPLSKKRMLERGFNQVEWVAQKLIVLNNSLYRLDTKSLEKIKHTPSQTSLKNKTARINNMLNAFSVSEPEKIKGRNIILLDDVITTGSTMENARKALLEAGARQVFSVAIAH